MESLLLSCLSGIPGVLGSALALALTGMSLSAEGVTIAFEPSMMLAFQGMLIALVVGALAGVAPGWHAARAEIVPALRDA